MSTLAPGYRFLPTDEEAVHYLEMRNNDRQIPVPEAMRDANVYGSDPESLIAETFPEGPRNPKEGAYLFTQRDPLYPNGSRPNRKAGNGFWRATGSDQKIMRGNDIIGNKKTLNFLRGGHKTRWIMHEYTLPGMRLNDWVLCFIYERALRRCDPQVNGEEEVMVDLQVNGEEEVMVEENPDGQEHTIVEIASGEEVMVEENQQGQERTIVEISSDEEVMFEENQQGQERTIVETSDEEVMFEENQQGQERTIVEISSDEEVMVEENQNPQVAEHTLSSDEMVEENQQGQEHTIVEISSDEEVMVEENQNPQVAEHTISSDIENLDLPAAEHTVAADCTIPEARDTTEKQMGEASNGKAHTISAAQGIKVEANGEGTFERLLEDMMMSDWNTNYDYNCNHELGFSDMMGDWSNNYDYNCNHELGFSDMMGDWSNNYQLGEGSSSYPCEEVCY